VPGHRPSGHGGPPGRRRGATATRAATSSGRTAAAPPSPVTITEQTGSARHRRHRHRPTKPSNGRGSGSRTFRTTPGAATPPGAQGRGRRSGTACVDHLPPVLRAYEPRTRGGGEIGARKTAGTVTTMASAIVHAQHGCQGDQLSA